MFRDDSGITTRISMSLPSAWIYYTLCLDYKVMCYMIFYDCFWLRLGIYLIQESMINIVLDYMLSLFN